jgi:predicted GIY-YIG superfamily endonuclease
MYLVYLLRCENRSYVGMTNDFFRRWRQHNCEIKGGAKYTSCFGSDWYPILIIDGFKTMKEAMQCEWKLKRRKGVANRVGWAHTLLTKHERWTSRSPIISSQNLRVYVDPEYKKILQDYPTYELYWR